MEPATKLENFYSISTPPRISKKRDFYSNLGSEMDSATLRNRITLKNERKKIQNNYDARINRDFTTTVRRFSPSFTFPHSHKIIVLIMNTETNVTQRFLSLFIAFSSLLPGEIPIFLNYASIVRIAQKVRDIRLDVKNFFTFKKKKKS